MVSRRLAVFIYVIFFTLIPVVSLNAGGKGIISSTTQIGCIIKQLSGSWVSVETLIPWEMCPGHFDITPNQAKSFQYADLLIIHGFEGDNFLNKAMQMTGKSKLSTESVNVNGSWMVPNIHIEAAAKIKHMLQQFIPDKRDAIEKRFLAYQTNIKEKSKLIKAKANVLNTSAYSVVCSNMQQPFLEWLGFNVVATYGRPGELTPQTIIEVVNKAKQANVQMVVDNLQSGANAGKMIAVELNAIHITLTNFPKQSYIDTLEENASNIWLSLKK